MLIKAAINKLPSGDIKYFKEKDTYRLRIGGFRILYFIAENSNIHIDKIGARGDIYK